MSGTTPYIGHWSCWVLVHPSHETVAASSWTSYDSRGNESVVTEAGGGRNTSKATSVTQLREAVVQFRSFDSVQISFWGWTTNWSWSRPTRCGAWSRSTWPTCSCQMSTSLKRFCPIKFRKDKRQKANKKLKRTERKEGILRGFNPLNCKLQGVRVYMPPPS